ncbi:MAG: 2-iminoacetate synthase ThiH [Limisphaerales bacterium]
MEFSEEYGRLPIADWLEASRSATARDVRAALGRPGPLGILDFARLISPAAGGEIEGMARRSAALTRQRFGKVIRLFAPLYLSNECINNCAYCGFSRDNAILRVTLGVDEVVREARALKEQGFRNVLLVAGEHPRFVSDGYLRECVAAVAAVVPGVSIEVGPMEAPEYRTMVGAGAEGLVVYQETYDREIYGKVHTLGPKKDFDWRLATPERGYEAGFRRLGIGALFGLADWRWEALSVAVHAAWLTRQCWKAQITVSLPRLRPCAGEFQPLTHLGDREWVQLICAMRLFLPDAGLVLSTREPARLRDGVLPLGITLASAGSHTEPGGYTGAGREKVHYTRRGRIEEAGAGAGVDAVADGRVTGAAGQFDIADNRSPAEVARVIAALGFEPVWKDWEEGFGSAAATE